jgi:hypothetical protein
MNCCMGCKHTLVSPGLSGAAREQGGASAQGPLWSEQHWAVMIRKQHLSGF